jgi:hypothetical protein
MYSAIQPGEDFRAGRWWWEDASKKNVDFTFTNKISKYP